MPIKIILTLAIVAIVLGVSLWQLNFFLGFNEEKEFREDLANIFQTIKTTQSFGSRGSFTTVWVEVPAGKNFTLSIDKNNFTTYFGKEMFWREFTADIKAIQNSTGTFDCDKDPLPEEIEKTCIYPEAGGFVYFPAGSYTLRLYYGTVLQGEEKDWTIYFE